MGLDMMMGIHLWRYDYSTRLKSIVVVFNENKFYSVSVEENGT